MKMRAEDFWPLLQRYNNSSCWFLLFGCHGLMNIYIYASKP